MHVAIQTALVIPALTIMLTGCATFRIAGAITARHVAVYLSEHDPDTLRDALAVAYKLQGLIRVGKFIDGIEDPAQQVEFKLALGNLLSTFLVGDPVLALDVRDLYEVLMPETGVVIPYDKVKDVRYMVDAFIDVAERGLREIQTSQDNPRE